MYTHVGQVPVTIPLNSQVDGEYRKAQLHKSVGRYAVQLNVDGSLIHLLRPRLPSGSIENLPRMDQILDQITQHHCFIMATSNV